MKPAIQFLELLLQNPTEIIDDFITREHNRRKGLRPIGYYFNLANKNDQDEHEGEYNLKVSMDPEEEGIFCDDASDESDVPSDDETQNKQMPLNSTPRNGKTTRKKRVEITETDEPEYDNDKHGFTVNSSTNSKTVCKNKQIIVRPKKPKPKKKIEVAELDDPELDDSTGFILTN
jgi:hypothetical protein